ncbi:hypothetical protein ADUPG1_011473 [Aduncisulcus paluster]|uniref:Band 7 domain-containing protein n=1 Tax=Aduncisulcus paluster TaxID=2918883 RepID=A0ABQ5JW18_9EUKA|nr:hypothetical protein ADUPG1_011473 [Aduncisulcus paluster]
MKLSPNYIIEHNNSIYFVSGAHVCKSSLDFSAAQIILKSPSIIIGLDIISSSEFINVAFTTISKVLYVYHFDVKDAEIGKPNLIYQRKLDRKAVSVQFIPFDQPFTAGLRKQYESRGIPTTSSVIVGDRFGTLYVFDEIDKREGDKARCLLGHIGTVSYANLTPNGIYTADKQGAIRLHSFPDTFNIISFFQGHDYGIAEMVTTDKYIFSLDSSGCLNVFDLSDIERQSDTFSPLPIASIVIDDMPSKIVQCSDSSIVLVGHGKGQLLYLAQASLAKDEEKKDSNPLQLTSIPFVLDSLVECNAIVRSKVHVEDSKTYIHILSIGYSEDLKVSSFELVVEIAGSESIKIVRKLLIPLPDSVLAEGVREDLDVVQLAFGRVDFSHVGLVRNSFTKNISEDVYTAGIHFIGPTCKFIEIPITSQSMDFEGKNTIRIRSSDGVWIDLDLTIQYTIDSVYADDLRDKLAQSYILVEEVNMIGIDMPADFEASKAEEQTIDQEKTNEEERSNLILQENQTLVSNAEIYKTQAIIDAQTEGLIDIMDTNVGVYRSAIVSYKYVERYKKILAMLSDPDKDKLALEYLRLEAIRETSNSNTAFVNQNPDINFVK